jgi:hypothetical protein
MFVVLHIVFVHRMVLSAPIHGLRQDDDAPP